MLTITKLANRLLYASLLLPLIVWGSQTTLPPAKTVMFSVVSVQQPTSSPTLGFTSTPQPTSTGTPSIQTTPVVAQSTEDTSRPSKADIQKIWITGIISFISGVLLTWLTHLLTSRREKSKLLHEDQKQHEQQEQQNRNQLRNELLRGLENPGKAIQELESFRKQLTDLAQKIEELEEEVGLELENADQHEEVLALSWQRNSRLNGIMNKLAQSLGKETARYIFFSLTMLFVFVTFLLSLVIAAYIFLRFLP